MTVRDIKNLKEEYNQAERKIAIEELPKDYSLDDDHYRVTYTHDNGQTVTIDFVDRYPGAKHNYEYEVTEAMKKLGLLQPDFPSLPSNDIDDHSSYLSFKDYFEAYHKIYDFEEDHPGLNIDSISLVDGYGYNNINRLDDTLEYISAQSVVFNALVDHGVLDTLKESELGKLDALTQYVNQLAYPALADTAEKFAEEYAQTLKNFKDRSCEFKGSRIEPYFQNNQVVDAYKDIKDMTSAEAFDFLKDHYSAGRMIVIDLEKDGKPISFELGRITAADNAKLHLMTLDEIDKIVEEKSEFHNGIDLQLENAKHIYENIERQKDTPQYKFALKLFPKLEECPSLTFKVKNALFDHSSIPYDNITLMEDMMLFAKVMDSGEIQYGYRSNNDKRPANDFMWEISCGQDRQMEAMDQLVAFSEARAKEADIPSSISNTINELYNIAQEFRNHGKYHIGPADCSNIWIDSVMALARDGFDEDPEQAYKFAKENNCLNMSNPFANDLFVYAIQHEDREGIKSFLTRGKENDVKDKYVDLIIATAKEVGDIRTEGLSRAMLIS